MSRLITVATCNLDQWALDFDANLSHTLESIYQAKAKGARYRLGPELELSGYGCEDHFLEQSLATILSGDATDDILCDIGMPVMHHGVRYNCRVLCCNRKILWIRPKIYMADDGNYRETRWFTPWREMRPEFSLQEYVLEPEIAKATGQKTVPIGWGALRLNDTMFAPETCEELFTPASPHIDLGLAGVEVFGNGSGSHHQLRKLDKRVDLIRSGTAKNGGIYLYANQQGCDGGRLYFDGCALIVVNGEVVAQGSQFSVQDVEVITATVDLEDVRSFRGAISSRSNQAAFKSAAIPVIHADFSLCDLDIQNTGKVHPSLPIEVFYHSPEEEIGLGPACWLWDYLRRSGASGYFLPLSGGADSSSVAAIVGVMCNLVVKSAKEGNQQTIRDARRIGGEPEESKYIPTDPAEFASRVLHTTYMGTDNSSAATKNRAATLAKQIGAYHLSITIDTIISAVVGVFSAVTGKVPHFSVQGGTINEDLALQNIQARLRMVMAYLLAQLLPWVRSRKGFLLVLGSANVDEGLRGYMTKYDCSSADLNPIGAISKGDLKRFLKWCGKRYNYPALLQVEAAPPTAELRPQAGDSKDNENTEHSQLDEDEMGMTYEELGFFGRLRKMSRSGPVTMFAKLTSLWPHLTAQEVAEKVKRFFFFYSINRHKMVTLTPSYHAEEYSPDDNRFDLRQFLYNARWPRQFRTIDALVEKLSKAQETKKPAVS